MTGTQTRTVLVVDDEQSVADLYATWLAMDHDVRRAYGGEEAIECVDEDVDVVFLDRQMPGRSGDDVLATIRERGIDTRVVMVTAVDPNVEIVEMPFDGYLTKPVTREELKTTVQTMIDLDDVDETLQTYYTLASKKATLEAEKTSASLLGNPHYEDVVERLSELAHSVDSADITAAGEPDSVLHQFSTRE